jgi:uncharacterized repeat protein (TIGR03803 family)
MKYSILFTLVLLIAINVKSFAQAPVFYGMVNEGGSHGDGTIIKFDPTNNEESVLWNLGGSGDGINSTGNFTYSPNDGLLYGMATQGGKYSGGTIISFNPSDSTEKVLWNLGYGGDGYFPWGSFTYNSNDGLLYGTTDWGGFDGIGAIISFNPETDSEKVVWSFGGTGDGQHPVGNLVYDANSDVFYGMTAYGGSAGNGIIFGFSPSDKAEKVLWSFQGGNDGENPYGGLVYDNNNSIYYGMTNAGGTRNVGTIISFDPTTNTESVLWSFGETGDGYSPQGSLIYDNNTNAYYGTTTQGGSYSVGTINSGGTIICFHPTNNTENVVWSFGNGNDGKNPYADLTYDNYDSLYYAMTYDGGTEGYGTIISFDATNKAENVLYNFKAGNDGYFPQSSLTLYNITTGIDDVNNDNSKLVIYPNPSDGKFKINGLKGGQNIEIYNCLGQKIFTAIGKNNFQQINISKQPNGIYFVRILNAAGSILSEKKMMKIN